MLGKARAGTFARMSFNLDYNLFVDVDAPGGAACLLVEKTSSPRSDRPTFIQADKFPLNLYFRRRGNEGNASTAVPLDALTVVLGAKLLDNLSATTLLFSAAGFAETGTGDDLRYQAVLDLNTAELAAALTTAKSCTARINIEIETAGNARRLSYQFDVTVQKQTYGGEAAPTPGTPIYPHPSLLLLKQEDGARWRFKGGEWQYYFSEDGKWRSVGHALVNGVPAPAYGAPED